LYIIAEKIYIENDGSNNDNREDLNSSVQGDNAAHPSSSNNVVDSTQMTVRLQYLFYSEQEFEFKFLIIKILILIAIEY
jgi:hypothetical protein